MPRLNNNQGAVQNHADRLTSGEEAGGQLSGPQTLQQRATPEGYRKLLAGSLGSTVRETTFIKKPYEVLDTPGGLRQNYNSDPMQAYYYTKDENPLSDFGVNSDRQINQYGHLSFGEVRPTRFPQDISSRGETINWSYAGYFNRNGLPGIRPVSEVSFDNSGQIIPLGDIIRQAMLTDEDRFEMFSVDEFQAEKYRLVFPNGYNMAKQLSDFAARTTAKRLPENQENELLRGIPFRSTEVERQIRAATGLSVEEFINRRATELNRSGVPQFPLTNALEVQEYLESGGNNSSNARAGALQAYPADVYAQLVEETFVDIDFVDFSADLPFVKDLYSSKNNLFSGQSSNEMAAEITGEYNFYLKKYQTGASDPNIPESVLPNFYIYNILSEGAIQNSPLWQGSNEAAQELQGNYDSLVRIDEFYQGILPRVSEQEFLTYLEGYGDSVSQGVEVDIIDQILRNSRSLTVPTSDVDIFEKIINKKRKQFPMSIDIKIPTTEVKELGSYINQYNISSRVAKSIKNLVNTSPVPYNVSTSGFQIDNRLLIEDLATEELDPSGLQSPLDPFLLDNPQNQPRLKGGITSDLVLNTYTFEEFFNNLTQNIESMTTLTTRGQEGTSDDCLDHFKRMVLSQMRSTALANAEEKKISYAELLQGKNFCESETLMFKLTKRRASDASLPDLEDTTLIQEYYFANTDLVKVIEFIDTQVKYNTPYYYELTAYAVVYGSTFRFRAKDYIAPLQFTSDSNGNTFYEFIDGDIVNNPFYFSFHVETFANPKIVELPVLSNKFTQNQVVPEAIGGVSYPVVRCRDLPPVAPLVFPTPYKDNYRQVLFLFQTQNASFLDEGALKYIPFNASEELTYEQISRQQKIEKFFNLRKGFASFQSEGQKEIESILIYRTDNIDEQVVQASALYQSFTENTLIKKLTVSCDDDVPDEDRAKSFDFVDTLEPNKKYYYTFRSMDVNGQKSVPTPIYEIELYFEKGLYVPYIKLYEPKLISKKVSSKRFARFLEIKSADIQTTPYAATTQHGDLLESVKSLVGYGANHVDFNDFLVRITSKDTGRRMDIKLSFTSRENIDPEEEACDDLSDSQAN